jgi:hypothetical protein
MAILRTETAMFPLVESWLESGMTQKEFSRQQQIPTHVLVYWIGRYRKTHRRDSSQRSEKGKSNSFIRLSTTIPSANGMEVCLPTGVVIRFANPVAISYLEQLLSACSD